MRCGCCLFPLRFQQLRLLRAPYMFRVLKNLPKDLGGGGCGRGAVSQIFHNSSCMSSLPKTSLRANGIQHADSLADKCHRHLKESRESVPCNFQSIKETNTSLKVTSLSYIFSHTSPHSLHSTWINPPNEQKPFTKHFSLQVFELF